MKINGDWDGLAAQLEKIKQELIKDFETSLKGLASATRAHIVEEVKGKLPKWDQETYLDNLTTFEQISEGIWEITLKERAVGIDDGRPAWDMKGPPGGLLYTQKDGKGEIKTVMGDGPNKGKKYRVVPFQQGKSSESLNPERLAKSEESIGKIKTFLKTKGLS